MAACGKSNNKCFFGSLLPKELKMSIIPNYRITPEDFRNPEIVQAYLDAPVRLGTEILTMLIAKMDGILPPDFGIKYPQHFRGEFYRYQQLGWEYVPISVKYVDGKKKISFPFNWPKVHFTSDDFTDKHNGILIKTGPLSNLMVLDFDLSCEEFKILDEKLIHGALNSKTKAATPRGFHIYLTNSHAQFFKNRYKVKSLTTVNKSIGVDVRESGAGVIAPKTLIVGYGEYIWWVHPTQYNLNYDRQELIPLMDAIFKYREANTSSKSKVISPVYLDNNEDNWLKAKQIVSTLSQYHIAYPDWVKIGMALYAGFGEQGKYLWDYFLSNPNYNDTERTIDTHWRSFRSVNRVTLASLFYIAEKYGINL